MKGSEITVKQETSKDFGFLGKMMIVIYVINFVSVITMAVSTIGMQFSSISLSTHLIWRKITSCCNVLNIIDTIAFCVCLFVVGRCVKAFRISAILLVLSIVLDIVRKFFENPWALLLTLAILVIAIFQMKFFVDGLKSVLNGVNNSLSKEWSTYWIVYVIILAATVIFGVVYVILSIQQNIQNILVELLPSDLLYVWMLAEVLIGIWLLILLRKTAGSIAKYALATKNNGEERAEIPVKDEETGLHVVKGRLYVMAWMILFMVISVVLTYILGQIGGSWEDIFLISRIAIVCKYVMLAAAIVIGLTLATLTRRQPFFLVAGILCVIGNALEFLRAKHGENLISVTHSINMEYYLITVAVVLGILQVIFLAMAIAFVGKKERKILARAWVGFSVVNGIVLTCVAVIPPYLLLKGLSRENGFFEKWSSLGRRVGSLYNFMVLGSRAANVAVAVLGALLLILIVATMVEPEKTGK